MALSIMSSVSQRVWRGWRSKRQKRTHVAQIPTVSISAMDNMCFTTLLTVTCMLACCRWWCRGQCVCVKERKREREK